MEEKINQGGKKTKLKHDATLEVHVNAASRVFTFEEPELHTMRQRPRPGPVCQLAIHALHLYPMGTITVTCT